MTTTTTHADHEAPATAGALSLGEKMTTEKCGATRDFGKGTQFEGLIVAECEKAPGHDKRGWHRAQGLTLSTPGGPKQKGGRVEWNGDDREAAS